MAARSEIADYFTITELTREFGVSTRTIRFYEDEGLIKPVRRGRTRLFRPGDRWILSLILRGKRLGFSLARIQEYLSLYDTDATHKGQLEHLLAGTQRRIEELEAQRGDLDLTLDELREIEELTLTALAQVTQSPKNHSKKSPKKR